MKILILTLAGLGSAGNSLSAADRFTVTVANDLTMARPSETVVIPFEEVKKHLPDVQFGQVIVRDARGKEIPSQVTSYVHSHKGEQPYKAGDIKTQAEWELYLAAWAERVTAPLKTSFSN